MMIVIAGKNVMTILTQNAGKQNCSKTAKKGDFKFYLKRVFSVSS
jgi:hypothetical protein